MKRSLLLVLAFLLLASPARAGFDEGMSAFRRSDYAAALRELRPLAERGDARARYTLGVMYQYGSGVREDAAEAAKWYRLAAEQGEVRAQAGLGFAYQHGEGVPKDFVQAHKWISLSVQHYPAGQDREYIRKQRDALARKMTSAQIAEAERLAREWKPRK